MQRYNVRFPDPLVERGMELARRKDVKFQDVVRAALERYLNDELPGDRKDGRSA